MLAEMSAVKSVTSSRRVAASDDTLELLFNENDGILTAEVGLGQEAHSTGMESAVPPGLELDEIISSILSDQAQGADDIDLQEFLTSSGPGEDVMNQFLDCSPVNEPAVDADSFLGSPPLLPTSVAAPKADPSLVTRDHSYSVTASTSHVCDFSDNSRSPNSDFSAPSPHADIPLFMEEVSEQRPAPGKMRSGRRSRNSTGSGSGLPYTVHDLDIGPPSPGSFEEDSASFGPGHSRRSHPASDDSFLGSPGELLVLTDEERQLLAREGVDLPSHLPLTREEERALRTVRRKIRNKISAKNSRLKKQEYVSGLEQRVKVCSRENRSLRGSLDSLRSQNRQLLLELKRLRNWVSERLPGPGAPFGAGKKVAFYALMLSFALVLTPMLSPFWSQDGPTAGGGGLSGQRAPGVLPGRSRSLLQEKEAAVQVGHPYHITVRPLGPPWQVPPKSVAIPLANPRSGTAPLPGPNVSQPEEFAEPEAGEEAGPEENQDPAEREL